MKFTCTSLWAVALFLFGVTEAFSQTGFGIGTNTPAEKLDVVGAIRLGNTSNNNNGTIRWTGTDFEGRMAGNWVSLTAGGVTGSGTTNYLSKWTSATTLGNSLLFDNGTNVGIGTTAPNTFVMVRKDQPGQTILKVENATSGPAAQSALLLMTDGSRSFDLEAFSSGYSTSGVLVASSGRLRTSTGMTNGLYLGTGNGPVVFYTNDNEKARISSGGNLGIGTTAPTAILDVVNPSSGSYPTGDARARIKTNSNNSFARYWAENDLSNFQMTGIASSANTINAHFANAGFLYTSSGANAQYYHVNKFSGFHAFEIGVGNDNPNTYTELMRISAAGVGIGTNNPTYTLDVASSVDNFQTFRIKAPGSPLMKWSGSYNSGNGAEIWQDATGNIRFNINATTNAIYASAAAGNNIGIGTLSPEAKLHVVGQVKITGGTPGVNQVLTSDATGLATWEPMPNDGDWTINGNDIYSAVSGNVGIGTAGPRAKVQIYEPDESASQASFTGGLNDAGLLITTDYTHQTYTPGIFWSTHTIGATMPKAGIYTYQSNAGSSLIFGTSNLYTNGLTNNSALVLDPNGRVGIGTLTPVGALQIMNALNDEKLAISGGTLDGSTYQRLSLYVDDTYGVLFEAPAPGNLAANRYDYKFAWRGGATALLIQGSSGNVGIGTTNPSAAKLEVNGDIKADNGFTVGAASSDVRIEYGIINVTASQNYAVTFTQAFTSAPVVTFGAVYTSPETESFATMIAPPTTTGFTARLVEHNADWSRGQIHWMAVGK